MRAKTLPWRTIITSSEEQVGRLRRDEVRRAFQEAKEVREAQAALTRRRARKAGNGRDR
jgi:hypothetical protein